MTDNEMDQMKAEIKAAGYGWIDGEFHKPTPEYARLNQKLSCISMINSILAYDWYHQTAEEIMRMQETSYHNYLEDYVKDFGRTEVVKMIQEQMDSIKEIKRCVHTDSEGCSYNAIIWKDPYKDEKEAVLLNG